MEHGPRVDGAPVSAVGAPTIVPLVVTLAGLTGLDTFYVWDFTLDIEAGAQDRLRGLTYAIDLLEIDFREGLELIIEFVAAVRDAGAALVGGQGLDLLEGGYDWVPGVLVLIEQLSAHVLSLLGASRSVPLEGWASLSPAPSASPRVLSSVPNSGIGGASSWPADSRALSWASLGNSC